MLSLATCNLSLLSSSLFSPFLTSFFTFTPSTLTLTHPLSFLLLLPFLPPPPPSSHHHPTFLHTLSSSSLFLSSLTPPSYISILQYINNNNNLPLLSFKDFYLYHSK
ncbi:hypothetical protein BKA57DRAFT_446361 [Linnemannia elongata]|nr:hypothetical protein BKA57DRAFT_446361 [Linnemannia elongata]